MSTVLGLYLFALAAGLVLLMFRHHARGECEFLSVRNVALVGFIIFQVTSGGIALLWNEWGRRPPQNPALAGLEFSAMATLFLILAFWAYRRGWGVTRLATKVPRVRYRPTDTGMLTLALVITVVAVGLRFGVRNPLIYKVSEQVGTGFAAVACGLVGWTWARRMLNPVVVLYSLAIVAANFANVMTLEFGRRGLVAVGGALLWGMYYSAWRHLSTGAMFRKLALLSIGPFLIVALFTAVRSGQDKDRTALEYVQLMASGAPLGEGVYRLLSGQDCAPISMWLIEKHPEEIEYRHLMTIRWFLMYPIPRDWWENKPYPMAQLWIDLANVSRVSRTLNIGPGIIGSAGAEGGWYALIIYALLGGLILRLLDEIITLQPESPIIVLAIGAALGEILALARGETGTFLARTMITIGGTLFLMVGTYKFLIASRLTPVEASPDDEPDAAAADEVVSPNDWGDELEDPALTARW